ncbi:MAG: GAF domain-containing protein [Elusimicrobia bacterium]|nr:GAF domain-containing protein [Elusimicrobiota bacterium]
MRQSRDDRVSLLFEAGRLISSTLDLGEVLKTILELSAKVVGSERASIFLLDEKTQCLYFDVALDLGEEVSGLRFPLGQGIAGSVAQERKAAIINDVHADPRWSRKTDEKTGFSTRSILAVPMRHKERLLGVLEAINKADGAFDEDDLAALDVFASQAAVAIENARLFSSLREERTKLDTMFSQMSDGAVLTDLQGAVILANQAACRLLPIGTGQATIAGALQGMAVRPPLAEVLAGGAVQAGGRASRAEPAGGALRPSGTASAAGGGAAPVPFEIAREKPTSLILAGTATAIAMGAPGVHGGGSGALFWFFRDVTDERRKDSLKRTFLSLISHKLKTPLASITGYAELLVNDPPAGMAPPDRRALESIFRQGLRLASLVNKLLNFTTLESEDIPFRKEPLDAATVVADAVSSLKNWLAENKATVRVECAGARVLGDRDLLVEVFKNLIENAVKFDPKPLKEVVVTACAEGAGAEGAGNGSVSVSVKDTGPGIPQEDLEKVFSLFHQIEESFTGQTEGAGLGLPYVKRVVERHAGTVRLDSALGRGTTATITLPAPG